mmetsp:Transcript_37418/g.57327  ORF Transcript_37418/g.57327 Transcript_37418/m.57327 type:complete len:95 (-) Transcript_37418:1661-1945(-)
MSRRSLFDFWLEVGLLLICGLGRLLHLRLGFDLHCFILFLFSIRFKILGHRFTLLHGTVFLLRGLVLLQEGIFFLLFGTALPMLSGVDHILEVL